MRTNNHRQPRGLDFKKEHFAPSHKLLFTHPVTGLDNFGVFPAINFRNERLESGVIKLSYGEHWGPNNGYGVHHIMQEHRRGIPQIDGNLVLGVVHFVAGILQQGADVHCEFSDLRGKHRPLVVRRSSGYVVLMPNYDPAEAMHYSVVTAVPKANAKGPRVGKL